MSATPDPDPGPSGRSAPGRRRRAAAPMVSAGTIGDVRPGSLLVALPSLTDPMFAGSVVYVLDHNATGTLGVVLGRPSEVRIRDVLPGWGELGVEPGVFHVGGPCETDTALCLAAGPAGPLPVGSGLRRVAGEMCLVDLDADPVAVAGLVGGLRVFAGYAGWSPDQLAAEIAQGAWAAVPGVPGDVLTELAGPQLWRRVLGRQHGRLAVLSTATPDPTAN